MIIAHEFSRFSVSVISSCFVLFFLFAAVNAPTTGQTIQSHRPPEIRTDNIYRPITASLTLGRCLFLMQFLISQQRMSFSKYNVNCNDNPIYASLTSPNPSRRPRQNSVFVGSTVSIMNPPRRAKSAIDIQHLVDYSPSSLSGCSSLLPMAVGIAKRPSITIETPQCARHRQSIVLDEPFEGLKARSRPSRNPRRPSCFDISRRPLLSSLDRPRIARHRHFISFDQPTTSWDRRTSITIERPSGKLFSSYEQPSTSKDQPALVVDPPATVEEHSPDESEPEPATAHRRPSFHLETPSPNRHRLSVSLDHASQHPDRRSSEPRGLVSTSLDETKIQITNYEDYIQISDV